MQNHANTAPEYLYHYTNISSLALILKNRTIKFTPLHLLDDLEEAAIQDVHPYSRYCYVSSWTDDSQESIPMWKMYTNEIDGVRIKLPAYPFVNYHVDEKYGFRCKSIVIPCETFFSKFKDLLANPSQDGILHKVEYTEDTELLRPIIMFPNVERIDWGRPHFLGRHKNTAWAFQREWRYILTFVPGIHPGASPEMRDSLKDLQMKHDLLFDNLCLTINDNKFTDFEVMLSPKINAGNRDIVNLLVREYNPNAKIVESSLKDKLR